MGISLFLLGMFALTRMARSRFERDLHHELALAWADGIPTNDTEFLALSAPVRDSENAGFVYSDLNNLKTERLYYVAPKLPNRPLTDAEVVKIASAKVAKYPKTLALLDAATKLPRCSFMRSSKLGKYGPFGINNAQVDVLLLRGDLEAAKNNQGAAIKDFQEALVICKHLRDEPWAMGFIMANRNQNAAIHHLISLAWRNRKVAAYQSELDSIISDIKPPDWHFLSHELMDYLEMIDYWFEFESEDPKQTTLKDRANNLLHPNASIDAKIKATRAFRAYWAALKGPTIDYIGVDAGRASFHKAFDQIPSVLKSSDGDELGLEDSEQIRFWIESAECYRLLYMAFARSLKGGTTPKTSDLVDPFTGKSVEFHYKSGKAAALIWLKDAKAPYSITIRDNPEATAR